MKKTFDSVVIAAVYIGNPDLIPEDRSDLKADIDTLSHYFHSNSSFEISENFKPENPDYPKGTLVYAMRKQFGSFCDFDCASQLYLETDALRKKHPLEKRIDTVRGIARQFIRPAELDI